MKYKKEEALDYHRSPKPGKIAISLTKPCSTQHDLSLAYTPGVAEPCREIQKNPEEAWHYTSRGNLVGVITDGTAVLGLGDIGPLAGKPVMEGKALLFKKFADVDAFDLEVAEQDPDKFISIVSSLEPTFGGINLEDIKAPKCFYIEEKLSQKMQIPVFHDDQHGTAVITAAGLINALELTNKSFDSVKIVFCGAGAAAIACARFLLSFGAKKENIWMCDKSGLVTVESSANERYRALFAKDEKPQDLRKTIKGADVFIGLSAGNVVDKEMIKSMALSPIVFAMANPDPEILPEDVFAARPDAIVATGRSDYPNQINNVLGFPFIFRGALDAAATKINEEMKIAAAHAIASLARQPVTDEVKAAYEDANLQFGKTCIIPKPLDSRVLFWEASAVVKAAMDSKVAKRQINDLELYRQSLKERIS